MHDILNTKTLRSLSPYIPYFVFFEPSCLFSSTFAKQCINKLYWIEGDEVVFAFAEAGEKDRHVEFGANRKEEARFGGPVEFGDDDS